MRNRAHNDRGFTLLEILIAIGILAVGLVTIFTLFPIGLVAIKETVDGTRGGGLALTARAELASVRADVLITGSGARTYASQYFRTGPWEYPASADVFDECLYHYITDGGDLAARLVFDERRMLPIRLEGDFDDVVKIVTVSALSLSRDSDRLRYFYDTTAGRFRLYANTPDARDLDIYLRVAGRDFVITSAAWNDTRTLYRLAVSDPGDRLPSGSRRFEMLFPSAIREPAVNVPMEWAGGYVDTTVTPAQLSVGTANRNLAEHLCVDGWISVNGDWARISAMAPAGMPTTLTIADHVPQPAPPPASQWQFFSVVLPVVRFSVANVSVDPVTGAAGLLLPVLVDGARIAGGGAHLGMLEAGASIEVVLDGARGDFDCVNSIALGYTRATVTNITGVNDYTRALMTRGNFIRVDGRDYEIDGDYDAGNGTLQLRGAVPPLGAARYFNIVVGYDRDAGDTPGVARFPVTRVTRDGIGGSIASFTVGPDANGKLPTAFADGMINPVRVLPRNVSQFTFHVVFNQKSPSAAQFESTSSTIQAPSWSEDFDTPAVSLVFPAALSSALANQSSTMFRIFALSNPTSGGVHASPMNVADVDALSIPPTLTLAGNPSFTSDPGAATLCRIVDRNDFYHENPAGGNDIDCGTGVYDDVAKTVTWDSPLPDGIFVAENVFVRLVGSGSTICRVTAVDTTLDSFTVTEHGGGGYPANGENVAISIAVDAMIVNSPRARGAFVYGSDTVKAIYADQAGAHGPPALSFAFPGTGFPFSDVSPQRWHISSGDYIQGPDGQWYAVKAIINNTGDPTVTYDYLVLDRPYAGTDRPDFFFPYTSAVGESFTAQVATCRNYSAQSLRDAAGTRNRAAAFGFDRTGARPVDPEGRYLNNVVYLAAPLPPNVKAGDYIRAEGHANHNVLGSPLDMGLSDDVDADWRWYMIESIGAADRSSPHFRREIRLTSPYRGYIPNALTYQPASVTTSIVRTFDTITGAF